MDEERLINKLDELSCQNTSILISIAQLQEQIKVTPDHEQRIRSLEHWRWGLVGFTGVVTTFTTAWTSLKGGA